MAPVDLDPEARERLFDHTSIASVRIGPSPKPLFYARSYGFSRLVLSCFGRIKPVHSGAKLPSAGYHTGR